MSPRTKWVVWAVLGAVLAVALTVGASRPGAPRTDAQKAASIDASLRCPSCDGVSVLDSSASTAVAIRSVVATRVREGQTTTEIESFLESRYGEGILLRPPVSGSSATLWVLPLVGLCTAGVILGLVVWRRGHLARVEVSQEDRALVEEALRGKRAGIEPELRTDPHAGSASGPGVDGSDDANRAGGNTESQRLHV